MLRALAALVRWVCLEDEVPVVPAATGGELSEDSGCEEDECQEPTTPPMPSAPPLSDSGSEEDECEDKCKEPLGEPEPNEDEGAHNASTMSDDDSWGGLDYEEKLRRLGVLYGVFDDEGHNHESDSDDERHNYEGEAAAEALVTPLVFDNEGHDYCSTPPGPAVDLEYHKRFLEVYIGDEERYWCKLCRRSVWGPCMYTKHMPMIPPMKYVHIST